MAQSRYPNPQVRDDIGAERNGVPLPIFLVGGFQGDAWTIAIEVQIGDGQRSQFTQSQPGHHRQLVRQRSFLTESLLLSNELRVVFQPFVSTINRRMKSIERQRLVRPGRMASFLPRDFAS